MLKNARAFFAERGVMEVDCGALRPFPSVDQHINLIPAEVCDKRHYLFSSPEYAMKRLLSLGSGDIYQLSHVFRNDERGDRHSPEFTMAEWYRLGFSFQQMIDETVDFVRLFVGDHPVKQLTHKEASGDHKGDLAWVENVEPQFVGPTIHVITHYPADQAALAKVQDDCALRFEIYYEGFELANGYDELLDPEEHRRRFNLANTKRAEPYPLDPEFFETLERGLPPCCGVAVGFDRLMMARHNVTAITEVVF